MRPARAPSLYPAIAAAAPQLHRFALKLTRDRDDADDLVQSTALRAIEYSGVFAPGTNLGAWLHVILRHLWLTERNRPYRRRRADVDWRMLEIIVDGGQEARVRLREAERLIARLPAGMRTAITQSCEGLTMVECAMRAGIAVGTAKSRLSRARAALVGAGL
jgi:RNA polymerase sigma-70 factor (ECF subfamily)